MTCLAWLDLAQKRLDEAVFAAYGWKSDLSDEEKSEILLALGSLRCASGVDASHKFEEGKQKWRMKNLLEISKQGLEISNREVYSIFIEKVPISPVYESYVNVFHKMRNGRFRESHS